MKYISTINHKEYVVEILDDQHVVVDGQVYLVDFHPVSDQPVYSLLIDERSLEAYVYPSDNVWQVLIHGNQFAVSVEDERERRLRAASSGDKIGGTEFHLTAPMPGLVIALEVSDGQAVKKGDLLVILESMKMQNELKSPRDGIVSRIRVQAGQSVEQRQILLSVL